MKIQYYPEALEDLARLDKSVAIQARKAIKKLETQPETVGKPLGHKGERNLTGLREIKLRDAGIRVIYQVRRTEGLIDIIVIGVRANEKVYQDAEKRIKRTH